MEANHRPKTPRFWIALQPSIVRVYKVAGLVALSAILIGLLSFLVVNVFYFFDHSWVRPEEIGENHHKVIEVSGQLAEAKTRAAQLAAEKIDLEAQLAQIERTIAADKKFIAEVGTSADAPKTPEHWLVRRELEKAKLDVENAQGKKAPLRNRLENIDARIADQDKVVKRLSMSPYLKAIDHQRVVLAFVPYDNDVRVGTPLYGCSWGLVGCSKVGKVTALLDGEVTQKHPHDDSVQRGKMVGIDVGSSAARKTVLFAGGKPLWLF
jgi:hypothetical protein